MKLSVQIGSLRTAILESALTLDSKASLGSWLYLIAKDKLTLYSSNLGLLRSINTIDAEITEQGEVAISHKLLIATLMGLPETEKVTLSSGTKLEVKYGKVKSNIALLPNPPSSKTFLKDFPSDTIEATLELQSITLLDQINKVIFCTADSDNAINDGPWLSSVYLHSAKENMIQLVATNKIIAGQATIQEPNIKAGIKIVAHKDAWVVLRSLAAKRKKDHVSIIVADNEMFFKIGNSILGVRKLGRPYPETVLTILKVPDKFTSVSIDRAAILSILARLSAFAESNTLVLTFGEEVATLYTKGFNSTFEEKVPTDSKIKLEVKIGIGLQDMSNILSSMNGSTVVFKFLTSKDPVYLLEGTEDSENKYIMSPISTDWEEK